MSTPDHPSPIFDAADEEVTRYRAPSSLAVTGLLAGLFSPLTMFASVFWLVPLAAVVLSGLALRRIAARRSELVGRPIAIAGLLLGAAFIVVTPVDDLVYRYFVRQQARQFAEIWIDAVRNGQVYKAHHLMIDPRRRAPLESKLADFYKKNPRWQPALKTFVAEPTMRTLFALRMTPATEIRFYETEAEGRQDDSDVVRQIYAVTFPDEQGKPKSFFIRLSMQRSIDTSSSRASWTMVGVDGGVRPPGW